MAICLAPVVAFFPLSVALLAASIQGQMLTRNEAFTRDMTGLLACVTAGHTQVASFPTAYIVFLPTEYGLLLLLTALTKSFDECKTWRAISSVTIKSTLVAKLFAARQFLNARTPARWGKFAAFDGWGEFGNVAWTVKWLVADPFARLTIRLITNVAEIRTLVLTTSELFVADNLAEMLSIRVSGASHLSLNRATWHLASMLFEFARFNLVANFLALEIGNSVNDFRGHQFLLQPFRVVDLVTRNCHGRLSTSAVNFD